MYKIAFDDATKILTATIVGFWTAAEARQYLSEFERELKLARRICGGATRILIDCTQSTIQSQEVIEVLQSAQLLIQSLPGDRCAVVVSSSLAKIQTARTTENPSVRSFLAMAEATEWLAESRADPL